MVPRRNGLVLLSLTIFAGLALAGCARGNSSDVGTFTPTGGQPATTQQPATAKFTSASLERRLLDAADLPAGFTAAASGGILRSGCQPLDAVAALADKAGVKAESTYLKGQRGPVVSETVVQLSESQARASIAKLRGAVTQCGAGAGNRGAPLRLARLSLPKLGDQTAGLRMTLGTLSTADLVAVRAGTLLLLLSNGGADRPDTGLTVALARKALAKLQG